MPVAQLAGNTDEGSRTFVIDGEGHTLGNALRTIIVCYPDVEFCGYTVPHPAENKINFRIQMMTGKGKAIDALKRGLSDLATVCDVMLQKFDNDLESYKEHYKV
ncbi:DNA-directed RNA polymerases I and III subunit RPAC2 [Onthophagus taurus]|uniref:DNA-directed RNA polymerases I and III subunit RPAC2 n=1 Tax=Onthophagus taurus TaxID=166361 RepID=UPI0039BE6A79